MTKLKVMPKRNWFHQRKNFGLGNFIMTTPALRVLGRKRPVPVFFDNKPIAELYQRCSFITILRKRPSSPPFGNSKIPNKISLEESDSEAYFRMFVGKGAMPNTYVDTNITKNLKRDKRPHIAVFHGCLNQKPGRIRRKDLGLPIRRYIVRAILERDMVPVLLGNSSDYINFWQNCKIDGCVNFLGKLSLRDSVSILAQCDAFISNDTGLYHAAGALKKNGLVLWRLTNPNKNRAVFSGIKHAVSRRLNFKYFRNKIDRYLDAYSL